MGKPENPDIRRIISHWGLMALKWEKVKDVYKVKTNRGLKNLKVSPLNVQRLTFVHHAVNHLARNGFQMMKPLIPTTSLTTYVCHNGKAYSLFDWIDGRQSNFNDLNELINSGKILAEFHRRSAGFTPPAHSNMRNQIGKCLHHFEERYQQLLDYTEIARHSPDDPFAQIYLTNLPFFLPMAERAITRLKNSDYQQLVQQAQSQQTFCHGDPAARNFIVTHRHQMYMIDFDSCRLDLPIMDLIKFTRRVLKKYNWSYPIAKMLIDAYQEVNRLNLSELEVMKAVFYFPQKFWRMSNRHFAKHNHHTPERELHKFEKYLSNRNQLAQFETDFDSYQ
ncbi:MAG TPA: CotS family spore coat protein [Bacillota bacterium]|nr:CotS family spore coat protein [Bacillota bacterium]